MSEIRLDHIHNCYVLIAPERLRRPNTTRPVEKKTSSARCPFCEGNEELTPHEIFAMRNNAPNTPAWKTRVVPNLYKAVQVELQDISKREGMFESIPGVGAHEILIDSPCHDCDIVSLGSDEIENWLRTMVIRIDDLQKDYRLIHLSLFKNFGVGAGATQEHPHTQILTLPIMPKDELSFLERNMGYYRSHGRGILADIVSNELLVKERVINQYGDFVAFCPYASAYPFEILIAPTKNIASLNYCSRKEITELSIVIKRVFEALKKQLGEFDYNLCFHLAPLNKNFENETYFPYLEKNYRFYLSIIPRIYTLGGFEVSMKMAINPIVPEDAAKLLRGE